MLDQNKKSLYGVVTLIVVTLLGGYFWRRSSVQEQEAVKLQDLKPDSPYVSERIPVPNRIPDYSIQKLDYVAIQDGMKKWRLKAVKAFVYQKENVVRAQSAHAWLYDHEGKITVVRAQEAFYEMNKKDLELRKSVESTFPNGLITKSDYLFYKGANELAYVPPDEWVTGDMVDKKSKDKLEIRGNGMLYDANQLRTKILRKAVTHYIPNKPQEGYEWTHIESDHAELDQKNQVAYYFSSDVPKDRVIVTQPRLTSKSKKAELFFGQQNKLRFLTALEDVEIVEIPKPDPDYLNNPSVKNPPTQRHATGGRADFDAQKNIIILKDYPQVYQNKDTIVGQRITLFRDSDQVEVEQSNAVTEGKKNP